MFLDNLVTTLNQVIFRYPDALNYLHSRGVTDDEIRTRKIGYSKVISVPDDGSPDRKRFMNESYRGKKFENKIIFPIQDPMERVIGIAGRNIVTKEFKTFITEEAKCMGFFFGLFQALPIIYKENRTFIVEGYFDQIAMAKVLPNTVATLTSSISDTQYEFLMMYCDQIITCFDSDGPGQRGTERALEFGNVYAMNIGYKDPAKCFESLSFSNFKEHITKKALIAKKGNELF